jgi:multidrug efflux pump subunit AcrB
MAQVTGPVIAIVLVLSAVFVPVAFLGGLTGQIYRQFAITIAMSVAISGFVALTLSPALCAMLLKPGHGRRKPWPFRLFDRGFGATTSVYVRGVATATRHAAVMLLVYAAIGFGVWRLAKTIPSGLLPSEDQGYVFAVVQLPDGASLQRTQAVVEQAEQYFLSNPAVGNVVVLGGLDFLAGRVNSPNAAVLFVSLKAFEERTAPGTSAPEIAAATMWIRNQTECRAGTRGATAT